MSFWNRRNKEQDWFSWFGKPKFSEKQKKIDYAKKKNIPIYIDDHNETSTGIYANFRAVVSEVELEKRISDHKKLYWQRLRVIITIIGALAGAIVWIGTKLKWF